MTYEWLTKLNTRQLHRVAAYIGAPCSGTKPTRICGIDHAVKDASQLDVSQNRSWAGSRTKSKPLSIVSIDMGVRNLAYCHLETYLPRTNVANEVVGIDAWMRTSIEQPSTSLSDDLQQPEETTSRLFQHSVKNTTESYDPALYAVRAHDFVTRIIESHQPTHILIERQRFRSGGSAAVQEWTIRVGVFEAMLYAAFHTLKAEKQYAYHLIPMSSKQVNRYWLESDWESRDQQPVTRKTASAVKLEKIECVRRLVAGDGNTTNLDFSAQALAAKEAFLSPSRRHKAAAGTKPKLDDLSDSFLQGLGWIHWQKHRLRIAALGPSALDLGT